MTALNRIVVKGFKSIREMDLELRNLNVLIGANGSGKSNLLTAFGLLREILADEIGKRRVESYVARLGGANQLLHFGAKTTQEVSMKLYLTLSASYLVECNLEATTDDKLVPSRRYSRHGQFYFDPSTVSELETSGAELKDFALQLADIVESWRVYHFQDTSDSARVKLTGDIRDNDALRPDGSNLAAMLYSLQQGKQDYYNRIVETVRLAAPFFDDFVLRPVPENPNTIILRWRERGSDQEWYANALSDGTLRFICLATLLTQPELPLLIIVDEPEIGLHPYAITLVASMLDSIATETQVIVSTQSSSFVSQFAPEDIIVVEREEAASVFRRLGAKEVEGWLDEYSLGELWEKNIIGGRP